MRGGVSSESSPGRMEVLKKEGVNEAGKMVEEVAEVEEELPSLSESQKTDFPGVLVEYFVFVCVRERVFVCVGVCECLGV